jgi:hypothetical protein
MEAGPFGGALQLGDIRRPDLVRSDRQELRLRIERVDSLISSLASLLLGGQESVHGADRAVITAFIEERRKHRRRRDVCEALAVEYAEQPILLGTRQCQRGPRPRARYAQELRAGEV